MNAKATMVTLQAGVIIKEFDFETAERILNWPNNGGWRLADKEFEFKDGVLTKRNTEKDKGKK